MFSIKHFLRIYMHKQIHNWNPTLFKAIVSDGLCKHTVSIPAVLVQSLKFCFTLCTVLSLFFCFYIIIIIIREFSLIMKSYVGIFATSFIIYIFILGHSYLYTISCLLNSSCYRIVICAIFLSNWLSNCSKRTRVAFIFFR